MLSSDEFKGVVAATPLISIDLVVSDASGSVLVGWRRNHPARDFWFVPGGRIRKNESLDTAFQRISRVELGLELSRGDATFKGVYEHFYDEDFMGDSSLSGTHYVVLAYRVVVDAASLSLPMGEQHGEYRWMLRDELDDTVHVNTRVYF